MACVQLGCPVLPAGCEEVLLFPVRLPILILVHVSCLVSTCSGVSFHVHIASIIGFMFLAYKLRHVEIIPCFGGLTCAVRVLIICSVWDP